MPKVQKLIVVLWLKLSERAADLMEKISLLEPSEPFESTEHEGMREAENFVSSLKQLSEAPEIVTLRLTNYDDVRITLKDTLRAH